MAMLAAAGGDPNAMGAGQPPMGGEMDTSMSAQGEAQAGTSGF
jgi:hypothetical protein